MTEITSPVSVRRRTETCLADEHLDIKEALERGEDATADIMDRTEAAEAGRNTAFRTDRRRIDCGICMAQVIIRPLDDGGWEYYWYGASNCDKATDDVLHP